MSKTLQTLDWYAFLERDPLPGPTEDQLASLRNTRVLITGAGGSIGSALALRMASRHPAKLVLLESSESHLFALQNALADAAPEACVTFLLGNVENTALLEDIFEKDAPQLVFHAAAFKHVPLLEEQPMAAMANNILGTHALARAAANHRARLVLLSTDKAVLPASVMGATKRVAELIALAAGGTALRLGNVLASRDSVAEVFADALCAGRSLTVTDPAARRYFLTIDEAVNLLLTAALTGPGLFAAALDTPHYIADLARFLARRIAPEHAHAIEFTHLRKGDKESEQLWSSVETVYPAHAGLHAIDTPRPDALDNTLSALEAAVHARDLTTAIVFLKQLVPDYTPSSAVRALTESKMERAAQ